MAVTVYGVVEIPFGGDGGPLPKWKGPAAYRRKLGRDGILWSIPFLGPLESPLGIRCGSVRGKNRPVSGQSGKREGRRGTDKAVIGYHSSA
jgi:hypothetical protein